MFSAKKLKVFHKPQKDIYNVDVDVPEDSWILSASLLKTPGENLLCTLNIIVNHTKNNLVKRFFLIINHNDIPLDSLENLLFINSVDVENETYSIFEICED